MTRARECPHDEWLPMAGGYRYECARCHAVGIRHRDGVCRAYSDGGKILRNAQAIEAYDAEDWRRNEQTKDREAREDGERLAP